jgi:sec-independent protein translocase protein TatC
LLQWLTAPLQQTLYYSSPGGGLALMLQIALTFGVILTIPVALFHLVRFVSPVLPPRSRLWLVGVITASSVLAALGMAAALFGSLPTALRFLEEFGGPSVQPLISTDRYFSFVLLYVGGLALLFQLPLLLVLLNQVVPLSIRTLMTQQRWVILGSFVVAALLTPTPDPLNQALLAFPMIGLYQVGVASVWVANRPRRGDQFADAETRAVLMALHHRQLITSWYQDFHGSHSLHCRWGGDYEGEERILVTVVTDGQHRLIATPE